MLGQTRLLARLHLQGRPVGRAVLRCVSKSETWFTMSWHLRCNAHPEVQDKVVGVQNRKMEQVI